LFVKKAFPPWLNETQAGDIAIKIKFHNLQCPDSLGVGLDLRNDDFKDFVSNPGINPEPECNRAPVFFLCTP
jgi:hypothetical protein